MGSRPSSFTKAVVVEAPTRAWSGQQQEIFNWFAGHDDYGDTDPYEKPRNLVVRARAGTGKTTTIIEGVTRAPESSVLVCAFNKRIADELTRRITNPAVEAKTLHSVGYGAIRRQWRGLSVAQGSDRGDFLTDRVIPKNTPAPIARLITLLHTKGRDMIPLEFGGGKLADLALFFDYAPDEGWAQWPLERVVEYAYDAMLYAKDNPPTYDVGVDFADMIFLPLTWGLLTPSYELTVVDEAQDLSLAQLVMAQRVGAGGRFCIVGDDRQAIYGFRGADSNSLDRLKRELHAVELPLTTTYRCGQTIVRRAQVLVPDIQAGPSNPPGVVDACDYEDLLTWARPGDFVLSRLNAPLVSLTLQFLKQGVRARMAGRDVGAGIVSVIRKLHPASIEDLGRKLTGWEQRTCTRLAAYGQVALVDRCQDQADMIRALAEGAEDLSDLENRIAWLFSDDVEDHEQILCSSVHKAKGLEADRVFVLEESLYRRGVTREEQNIEYVALTRAQSHLTLVTGVPRL